MSGKALSRMRSLLNGTGSYRLTETGACTADWETDACGAGFALAEVALETLLGDLFAATASEEALARWEKLFRGHASFGTTEERRTAAAARLAGNPAGFTPAHLQGMLRAAGVEGLALEEEDGLRVLYGKCLGVSLGEALRELDQTLPAHLPWTWDDRLHWVALEAHTPSFAAIDAKDLTWSGFEGLTREQIDQWEKEET